MAVDVAAFPGAGGCHGPGHDAGVIFQAVDMISPAVYRAGTAQGGTMAFPAGNIVTASKCRIVVQVPAVFAALDRVVSTDLALVAPIAVKTGTRRPGGRIYVRPVAVGMAIEVAA